MDTAFARLREQAKWVDLIVEVLDARAPLSSRHPNSAQIFGNKPRLIVLSKADLAHPSECQKWLGYIENQWKHKAIPLALKGGGGKDKFLSLALAATLEKREQLSKKGLKARPIRVCVVGIPNVGKSSLINWLIGQKRVKVANRPGVTRAPQWVRVHPQIELLDTAGVASHVPVDQDTLLKLALLNLTSEGSYDFEQMAAWGMAMVNRDHNDNMQIYLDSKETPTLEILAQKRNLIGPGGKLDIRRAASAFLSDLRDGKLGKVILDRVPTQDDAPLNFKADAKS